MKKKWINGILFLTLTLCLLCSCKNKEKNYIYNNNYNMDGKKNIQNKNNKIISDDFHYKVALFYLENKKYPKALSILNKLENYREALDLSDQIRYIMNARFLASGTYKSYDKEMNKTYTYGYIGALTAEGKIMQINQQKDSLTTDEWIDVKKLSAEGEYLDGLSNNGDIQTTCPISLAQLKYYSEDNINKSSSALYYDINRYFAASEMLDYKNIVDFISSYPDYCVAISKDGKIYNTKINNLIKNHSDRKRWKEFQSQEIVQVCNNNYFLRRNGTVGNINWWQPDWDNIVSIECGNYLYALGAEGTIFSTCKLNEKPEDIVAVSASGTICAFLKSDGTVSLCSSIKTGKINVDDWKDIAAIEVKEEAGIGSFIVGLKSDGTLVIAGSQDNSPDFILPDVSGVKGLYVPEIEIKTRSLSEE